MRWLPSLCEAWRRGTSRPWSCRLLAPSSSAAVRFCCRSRHWPPGLGWLRSDAHWKPGDGVTLIVPLQSGSCSLGLGEPVAEHRKLTACGPRPVGTGVSNPASTSPGWVAALRPVWVPVIGGPSVRLRGLGLVFCLDPHVLTACTLFLAPGQRVGPRAFTTALDPSALPHPCLDNSALALAAGAQVQAISHSLLLVLLQQQGWEGVAELHVQAQACSQELAAACGLPGAPALADAHAQRILDSSAQVLAQGGLAGQLFVDRGPGLSFAARLQLMLMRCASCPAACGEQRGCNSSSMGLVTAHAPGASSECQVIGQLVTATAVESINRSSSHHSKPSCSPSAAH